MAISAMDHHLLLRCEEIKGVSHDPHRQVGVLVADPAGKILAEGANAPPKALGLSWVDSQDAIARDPQWKYFMLEHAERNAIFDARDRGVGLRGATMYGTLFPCADCARAIAAAGITRLVLSSADHDPARDVKWRDHFIYANKIFEDAGIEVEYSASEAGNKITAVG